MKNIEIKYKLDNLIKTKDIKTIKIELKHWKKMIEANEIANIKKMNKEAKKKYEKKYGKKK